MTIFQYFDRRMASLQRNNASQRAVAEVRKCRAAMTGFLSARPDADMLEFVTEAFPRGFAGYLAENRDERASATMLAYMTAFRALVRHAQKEGVIPCSDFVDDAVKELKGRLPRQERGADPERTYSVSAHPFGDQFRRLLEKFASEDAASRRGISSRRHVLLYLFGMFFYGLEIDELAGLTAESDVNGVLTVALPRTAVRVPLSGVALWVASQFRGKPVEPGPIFDLTGADAPVAASRGVQAYMSACGIALYRGESVFADWLGAGAEGGASRLVIGRLAEGHISGRFSTEAEKEYLAIGRRNANDRGVLHSRWYVLVSYSSKLRGEQMRANVDKSGLLDANPEARTWDPVDTTVTRRDGKIVKKNSPAVSRYLFVKCTKQQADKVDILMPSASILRVPGNTRAYSIIHESEILRLQAFLRDFREEVQLVDIHQWGRDNKVSLAEGSPVRIISGSFAGFEGTVYRVRDAKGKAPYNSLTIRVQCAGTLALVSKIEVDLLDIDVEPLGTQASGL